MKCLLFRVLLLSAVMVLAGCAGSGPSAATVAEDRSDVPVTSRTAQPVADHEAQLTQQQVVATVNGRPITLEQLQRPLIEAHGLNVLLNLVQLELARQNAADAGVTVTPEDVAKERELTLRQMFESAYTEHVEKVEALKQQREQALHRLARAPEPAADANAGSDSDADIEAEQQKINRQFDERLAKAEADLQAEVEQFFSHFLTQERISRSEFNLVLQTNAHLRKIAVPHVEQRITEEAMQEAFRTLYGETVRIRHIQVTNMQEIAEARRRLAAGYAFEQVAREMSRNPNTAIRGGELPVFSRATAGLPDAFKDAAFGLEVGEVSDPVQAEGAYHLIKLEERFEPRAVRFEDVQDSLRQTLYDQWMQVAMRELRIRVSQQAHQAMRIEQPELRRQFQERLRNDEARMTNDESMTK